MVAETTRLRLRHLNGWISHMGWITNQMRRIENVELPDAGASLPDADEAATSSSLWEALRSGIERDADEFQRAGGDCDTEQLADFQLRIVNSGAKIAALITADPDAKTIEYSYQPESDDVAVPEKGIFTIREHRASEQLYSSDQQISLEQARQMILEPVLFPDLPTDQAIA